MNYKKYLNESKLDAGEIRERERQIFHEELFNLAKNYFENDKVDYSFSKLINSYVNKKHINNEDLRYVYDEFEEIINKLVKDVKIASKKL